METLGSEGDRVHPPSRMMQHVCIHGTHTCWPCQGRSSTWTSLTPSRHTQPCPLRSFPFPLPLPLPPCPLFPPPPPSSCLPGPQAPYPRSSKARVTWVTREDVSLQFLGCGLDSSYLCFLTHCPVTCWKNNSLSPDLAQSLGLFLTLAPLI